MERRNFLKKSGQALLAISAISITASLITSCSTSNDDSFNDGYYGDGYYDDGYYGDAQSIRDILMDGTWFVASYIDSGVDETSDYTGYDVNFNLGNQVVATNGSNTNNGTWIVSDNGQDLDLSFVDIPFNEFNSGWDIISALPNRIELRDISGGGGGTDILIFEKQ